jgi:nucleoside-diphosphate-sugar epimerase
MKIAILGATSQIAQDLILSFSKNRDYDFSLFGRDVDFLEKWIDSESMGEKYQVHTYAEFDNQTKYNVIINFVGVGDPAKAQKMGNDIFNITEQYDQIALDYIKHSKETKYIFLSSGAIFGGEYQNPVSKNTLAMIDINNLGRTNSYAIAKLYAEAKHRSLPDLSVVDVRVFNYFSHTQDMNARFLITDLVRALKNNEVFKTSSDDIVRDFITPPDFYNLIQSIIDFRPINAAIDCYTKSPVSKFDLLSELKDKFGLRYEINKKINIINATGAKMNYYSINDMAKNIGYKPENTSKDGIVNEIQFL